MSKVVKLQLFKGKRTFDEKGKVASPNDIVKIPHGSSEYKSLMENAGALGYTSVKVLSVIDTHNEALTNAYKQRDKLKANPSSSQADIAKWESKVIELREEKPKELDVKEFQNEIDGYFVKKVVETSGSSDEVVKALQKQNDALLARLDALEKGSGKGKATDKDEGSKTKTNSNDSGNDEGSNDLESLQKEFEELYGKKPHHKLGEEKLIEAINKKKAEKK